MLRAITSTAVISKMATLIIHNQVLKISFVDIYKAIEHVNQCEKKIKFAMSTSSASVYSAKT